MAANIVVLGSINMDLVVQCNELPDRGETIIATSSSEVPGGKGANQAVSASRAGGSVTMIGRVGSDAFGEKLLSHLRQDAVDITRTLQVSDCASGIALVTVESSGENSIVVVPGANGRVTSGDVDKVKDVIAHADLVVVQLEIPLDAVREAIQIARTAGVPVLLDPAPMPESLPDSLLNVDLICPNQSEAAALVGRSVDSLKEAATAVPELHRRGAKQVIITLGGLGTVVSDGVSCRSIPPFQISAVDTTAAGDAFAGALAVRWAEGAELFESATFASAAGAIAATRPGAQPSLPTRAEIEHMLSQRAT
ncbi:MAG: ribokinase [Rubripirellula sp.]